MGEGEEDSGESAREGKEEGQKQEKMEQQGEKKVTAESEQEIWGAGAGTGVQGEEEGWSEEETKE